jgi:hypothetical protein
MQVTVFWSLTAIYQCLGRIASNFRAEEQEDSEDGGSGLLQNFGQ